MRIKIGMQNAKKYYEEFVFMTTWNKVKFWEKKIQLLSDESLFSDFLPFSLNTLEFFSVDIFLCLFFVGFLE